MTPVEVLRKRPNQLGQVGPMLILKWEY